MKHVPRVGISGWTYAPWRKTFYPAGLAQRRELEFASRQVNSIEINGAFYSLARPSSFEAWYAATPADFVFSVKAHRFITHIKKLNHVEEPIRNFLASGVLALKEKLGPILWQFPPMMKFNPDRFRVFLETLPHDVRAATRLARRHGAIVDGRAYLPGPRAPNHRLRHAVEVRHESFDDPDFFAMLTEHNVALVTADSGGKFPYFEKDTADFRYARLHGPAEMYASGYDKPGRAKWARKVKRWAAGGDVFVYFDNDVKVRAPYDAVDMLGRVIPGYAPAEPMDEAAARGLKTPGPRMTDDDPRWRRRAT